MVAMVVGNTSATVSVAFPPEQFPGSLEEAMDIFASFGGIARMDMASGFLTGRLSMTFFDVRDAQEVLDVFQAGAEALPPPNYDFHIVSVAAADWPTTEAALESCGEIAAACTFGEQLLVEYYDMRAAQQAVVSVPGSRPMTPQNLLHSSNQVHMHAHSENRILAKTAATAAAKAVSTLAAAMAIDSGQQAMLHTINDSLTCVEYAIEAVASQAAVAGSHESIIAESKEEAASTAEGKEGGAVTVQPSHLSGQLSAMPIPTSMGPTRHGAQSTDGRPNVRLQPLFACFPSLAACGSFMWHGACMQGRVGGSTKIVDLLPDWHIGLIGM